MLASHFQREPGDLSGEVLEPSLHTCSWEIETRKTIIREPNFIWIVRNL